MNERALRILEFNKIIKIMMDYAISEPGKERISEIKVENDYDTVVSLLKETEDAVVFVRRRGIPSIDGIHNIKNSLRRGELGGILSPGELIKICDNMKVARRLKDHVSSEKIETGENTVEGLIQNLYQNKRLEERINSCILSEEEISDHASTALSSIRRQISSLQANVKDKLNDMIRSTKYQKFIQENVVTMRGERYVIPVKQEHRSDFPGLIHDSSASGATIFIEPMAVVEINNNIKQAKIKEAVEIERILKELTEEVVAVSDGLNVNIELLTQIDFLFAKARFALDKKCICPILNRERKVNIVKGRHPLLDTEKVVPIDFWIGDGFSTIVITGPNTGGKTVSLKTLGLFVLMTQAGLLIPANDGSSMCIFNNVFADIGDEQSIEQSLSTFSSHMKNIVGILDDASYGDLALFDELGAGTDPQEGAALAISILENLLKKKVVTVATTHYSELKVFALSHDGIENASCEFDVETLMPTYKLLIGVPGKSNAFSISKKLGLGDYILDRARELISNEGIAFEDVMQNLEKNLSDARNDREEAEKIIRHAEKVKRDIEGQKEKFNEKRDKIIEKANEEARKILAEAILDIDTLIKDIKDNGKKLNEDQRLNTARELKQNVVKRIQNVNKSMNEYYNEPTDDSIDLSDLKTGDEIIIKSLNQPATVLSPPDKNGEVMVMAGFMKMNININNLRPAPKTKVKAQPTKSGISGISASKGRDIKTEIDFRGYSIDEAVLELDKYLDDIKLSGIRDVRIIHGKGTGVLRQGIHKFLKSHHHVATYRVGVYGEGENGVTIVEIK